MGGGNTHFSIQSAPNINGNSIRDISSEDFRKVFGVKDAPFR